MTATINLGPLMASAVRVSPFSDQQFEATARAIWPQLLAEAKKIKLPQYMDHEDLAQEALLHIYCRRDQFDRRRSQFRAWSTKLARNLYLNLAVAAYRHRRHPAGYVPWTDDDQLEHQQTTTNEGYAIMRYRQLLAQVEHRLRPASRQVLRALVDQPETLLQLVRAEHEQNLRQSQVGSRGNRPVTVRISHTVLAQHLGLKYATVARAMREIARVAKQECAA